MNTAIRKLACFSVMCLFSSLASAGVTVIVNPQNTNTLNKAEVVRIYLSKTKTFPNGKTAIPIDRSEGSAIRTQFIHEALNKDENQLKAYWSRLIFTGRGYPPKEATSDEQVKEIIAHNPDAIGYINSKSVDNTVKVVSAF